MKKFNRSEIMKNAWNLYKMSLKWTASLDFGECLRRAWKKAKEAIRVFAGIVRNVQVAGTLMYPVLVDVDMNSLIVTGNTYKAREILKEFGLVWNCEIKAWIGSFEKLNDLCKKFA